MQLPDFHLLGNVDTLSDECEDQAKVAGEIVSQITFSRIPAEDSHLWAVL